MKTSGYRVKICVIGCGAIGSRIAESVHKDFKKDCRLTGILDKDFAKTQKLAKKLKLGPSISNKPLNQLIKKCDVVVEAVNAKQTRGLIRQALRARKTVLAMSIGKLLNSSDLFKLARKNKCYLLLPSGAIAGVDAIKAASLKKIKRITLTTRKPPIGFKDNPYFRKKGIDLTKIKKETLLFEGTVSQAVKHFPQNINVAATLSLAAQTKKNIKIRILTSPKFKINSHEVDVVGDFGHMNARTDNAICPDNPKTSYLAVLSGLQTLKQFCTGFLIGT